MKILIVILGFFLWNSHALAVTLQSDQSGATRGCAIGSLNCGLVGYWTFNNQDMNWKTGTVTDSSGSGNTGQLIGMSTTTSPVAGKMGQGLGFNGTNSAVRITSAITTYKTISLWFKLNNTTTAYQSLFTQIAGSNSESRAYYYPAKGIVVQIKDAPGCFFESSTDAVTPNLSANKWYHFVLVLGSTQSIAYLNGAVSSTTPTGNCVPNTGGDIPALGRGYNTGFYLNGAEDDVRIYNRALSAAEVKQLYMAGM